MSVEKRLKTQSEEMDYHLRQQRMMEGQISCHLSELGKDEFVHNGDKIILPKSNPST